MVGILVNKVVADLALQREKAEIQMADMGLEGKERLAGVDLAVQGAYGEIMTTGVKEWWQNESYKSFMNGAIPTDWQEFGNKLEGTITDWESQGCLPENSDTFSLYKTVTEEQV